MVGLLSNTSTFFLLLLVFYDESFVRATMLATHKLFRTNWNRAPPKPGVINQRSFTSHNTPYSAKKEWVATCDLSGDLRTWATTNPTRQASLYDSEYDAIT
jgi:hypothetical protein